MRVGHFNIQRVFMKTAAIVLAAGESKRLGRPKQLIEFQGQALVHRVVELAASVGCQPVVAVTGAYSTEVENALQSTGCSTVHNPDWMQGIGTSIAAGVRWLTRSQPDIEAVLIQLCDQLFVPVPHLKSLTAAVASGRSAIAATKYTDGASGVPACFAARYFEKLAALTGATGAKKILMNSNEALFFDCPEAAIDVDDANDLQRIP